MWGKRFWANSYWGKRFWSNGGEPISPDCFVNAVSEIREAENDNSEIIEDVNGISSIANESLNLISAIVEDINMVSEIVNNPFNANSEIEASVNGISKICE